MIVEAVRGEQIFLEKNGVKVTSTRFVVPDQTYAISGVTSIRLAREKPDTLAGLVGLVIGVLILLGATLSSINGEGDAPLLPWALGAFLAGLGVYVLKFKRRRHSIALTTAAGEERALTSADGAFIAEVADALNHAITYRG